MNKITNILLIISLMSLSSVSFATSLTAGDLSGSLGYIDLVDDGNNVNLIGSITSNSSVFYEVGTALPDTEFLAVGNGLDYTLYTSYMPDERGEIILFNAMATGTSSLMYDTIVANTTYYLQLTNLTLENFGYEVQVSASSAVSTVPVPAAGILFATALFGIGLVGRRKKKTSTNLMVGAFTRAS